MSDLREAAWLARCTGRGELAPFSPEELVRLAESIGVRHVAADTPLMTEAVEPGHGCVPTLLPPR